MTEKRIEWECNSYRALCAFPEKARRDAGFQLGFVQLGREPANWKPMQSIGSGVQEIRIDIGSAFRVIYIAKFDEAIYVLHAFQKKTQRTPKKDLELARNRLRDVEYRREDNVS